VKASRTKDSKGVVVLTTPSFENIPHLALSFKRLKYKACPKTGKASSILASPFNSLAYKALSVLLKAYPFIYFSTILL
jgi:hypothetical protein